MLYLGRRILKGYSTLAASSAAVTGESVKFRIRPAIVCLPHIVCLPLYYFPPPEHRVLYGVLVLIDPIILGVRFEIHFQTR